MEDWREWNVLALAYIGDAVYELWVREHLLRRGVQRVEELHLQTVALVRAKGQAEKVALLTEHLDETERNVFQRGRNAKGRRPQSVDLHTYRQATALEAVIGYLYLTGKKERLQELLNLMHEFA
jgi:ribonuclease-3 family protein